MVKLCMAGYGRMKPWAVPRMFDLAPQYQATTRVHTGSVAVLTQIAASDNATPCRDDSIVIPSWGRSVTQLLLR